MASDDAQIIQRVLAGGTEEYRLLVEKYQGAVFRMAWHMVGDRHEAEDLTQESLLAAFANLASYSPARAAFATWLLTIARNRCINHLKRKAKRSRGPAVDAAELAVQSNEPADEETSRLDAALAQLPQEQRTSLVLAEIEGLPYAEIARIQQTSLGTVKSRIHRAKQRLRWILEPVTKEL